MLGDPQAKRRQVEHLPGLHAHHARIGQLRAAPAAPVGHVPGHLVGLLHLRQVRAWGAGLLTGPAIFGPLIGPAFHPRGLAQPIRGRRHGGVRGVLAEPPLQLGHPRLQRGDQAGLLGVDRTQLDDDRSLHCNGGFQIRIRGRDRGLHDNEPASPLARGPDRTATPQPSDSQLAHSRRDGALNSYHATALPPADRAAWRKAAIAQPHRGLAARMLGLLVADDERSRAELLARAADGDWEALQALGDVRQLDSKVARQLATQDAQAVEAMITQAEANTFGSWVRDPARSLAVLGIWHPDAARWDVLLRFLAHEHVTGEHKRDTCLVLAASADQLPEPVRSALRRLAPRLTGTAGPLDDSFRQMLGRPLGGAAMNLAAAVGALDEHAATNGLAALLTGSRQDRRDAAKLIVRLGRPLHTAGLIPLISDPHADVRAEAAQALAIRVASPEGDTDTLAVTGLRRALADPGALMPLAIASGIATVRAATDQAGELVRPLLRHPSARVREATQAISQ